MTTFSGNSRRAVALLCVAQFVVVLDVTVVTTALPALGHELGFTPQGLPWVVTAYTLCFGGFLVVGNTGVVHIRIAVGDPRKLRGLPAISLGVSGAMLGTPHPHAIDFDRRQR